MIRDGFPVKRIDIDEEPDLRAAIAIEGVPAFVVVDRDGRELGRISGPRSASDLARFYKTAAAKARPPDQAERHVGCEAATAARVIDDDRRRPAASGDHKTPTAQDRRSRADDEPERPAPAFANPKPWETVVRIRVIGNRSTGFGSGTVDPQHANRSR